MTTSAQTEQWRIEVGAGEQTSAVFEPALGTPTGALFVCAHGAGGHINDAGMLAASDQLRRHGLHIVRFNFLYREKRSGTPDPMPRLKQCYAAVAEHARTTAKPGILILGGRSMGGRVASMLAADSYPCDGLLLLAYPLHPAGQPQKLRDAHLERIRVPVLCFNGTRDALCRRDLMQQAIDSLSDRWTMHWLDGADHGFHVLKASGRNDGDVLAEIGEASGAWITRAFRK
jgi:predicted alpha/beta-hydrolase family hydrolase